MSPARLLESIPCLSLTCPGPTSETTSQNINISISPHQYPQLHHRVPGEDGHGGEAPGLGAAGGDGDLGAAPGHLHCRGGHRLRRHHPQHRGHPTPCQGGALHLPTLQ